MTERFIEALAAVRAACEGNGLASGMFGYDAEMAANSLEGGFDFASVGSDISFLREGVAHALSISRREERTGPARGGY